MTPEQYQAFTEQLQQNFEQDERVVSLIALGSMANQSHPPDQWSDHDFFVVTTKGQQETFRNNLDWLPDFSEIVFWYRETEHGLKVLYHNGHLLEFAVFDTNELQQAKVNDYCILFDKVGIQDTLTSIQTITHTHRDDIFYFGQFLGHLQVGMGRYLRGEKLSASIFIKHYALVDLLELFTKHILTDAHHPLDNLDPLRRFEAVYPEIGSKINQIMLQEIPQTIDSFVDLFEQYFANLPEYPRDAIKVLRAYLQNAQNL